MKFLADFLNLLTTTVCQPMSAHRDKDSNHCKNEILLFVLCASPVQQYFENRDACFPVCFLLQFA